MNVVDGHLNVKGNIYLSPGFSISLPDDSISVSMLAASVTDPILAEQVQQQVVEKYTQVHGSAAVTARVPFHLAVGAGVINSVKAGISVAAVGDSTVTIDLFRNGTSIATPVSIDNGDAAYDVLVMTLDANEDDYVEDDVFELVVTATVGTGTLPQGLFVVGVFLEAAQA
jgi:hypothetical protein